jgi:hypothetical protein
MLDRMLRMETQAEETLEQQGNGDLRFGASQRRPEAVMRTAAKGEMARNRPLDIEAVRTGMPRRVIAGREERGGQNPPAFTSVPPILLSQVGFASTDAAGIVAVIDREPTPVNWLPSLADNF